MHSELQAEFYWSQAWALGIKYEGSRVCGSTTLSHGGVSAQRRACVSDSMSKSSQLTLQMRCHYRYEGFETKSSLSWVIGNEGIQFKESFEDAIDAQDIDEAKEADVKNEAHEAKDAIEAQDVHDEAKKADVHEEAPVKLLKNMFRQS